MQNITDGGPAFPHTTNNIAHGTDGMSLRDYFAAKALEAFAFSDLHDRGAAGIAAIAYEVADAMLRARAQSEPQSPADIQRAHLQEFGK